MTESRPSSGPRRRRRPQRRRQGTIQKDWICDGLLVAVVVGSVLAIGTVHISSLLIISALALVGATIELVSLRRVPWPAVVLAGLGLFSALQAVPLPPSWVTHLSPASAAAWLRCLVAFGQPPPRSTPLSLDPGASIAEALKWLTYAAVYVSASRLRSRRGSVWLALLLFTSAALVALTTLLHGAAGLGDLYGVYHPKFAVGRWSVGPLLNSNNLAGYAILGFFSGSGLLLSGRLRIPRWSLVFGLAAISTALCLSGSRAGVLCALGACVVLLLWLSKGLRVRISLAKLSWGLAPILIGVVCAVALGSAHDAEGLTSLDARRKVSVWLWSIPMIRDHALFGVGRGAFETAFSPYRHALDYDWTIVFTHAENFVVEWIAEWGVPVGLGAVISSVGYASREWFASREDRLRFPVMTGLLALFVQNLADLGLEVPALAIAAVVALAAGERSSPPSNIESPARPPKLVLAASIPALAVWIAASSLSRFPVEVERRELSLEYRQLNVANADDRVRFQSRLRAAVLRHPEEPFFALLGALVAARTAPGDALSLIGRSLELAPTNGPTHLFLAQLLQQHGATAQAMLHLRLAAQYDRTLVSAAGARAALWAPSVDLLMQAIPEGRYGEDMLLEACAKARAVVFKVDCSRRAALANPQSSRAQQSLAEDLLAALQAAQPPCEDTRADGCLAETEVALRHLQKLEPNSWRANYLIAKTLQKRGDLAGAAGLLTRACPTGAEGDACWREAVVAAIQSKSDAVIAGASGAFAARPCGGAESCADTFDWLADQLAAGEQAVLANTFYGKAAEADPSAARWLKVAEHALRAHLYGVARTALDRVDRSPDHSVGSRAHAELLRQTLVRAEGTQL